MRNHDHRRCDCRHDEVKFCRHCQVVHCLSCKQEWAFASCTRDHYGPWTWRCKTWNEPIHLGGSIGGGGMGSGMNTSGSGLLAAQGTSKAPAWMVETTCKHS
jgi:hypothetical protein